MQAVSSIGKGLSDLFTPSSQRGEGGFTFVLPFAAAPSCEAETSSAGNSSASADKSSPPPPDGSWELMPADDAPDDPRYDRHGFRRDAGKLEREEAFLAEYETRVEQQEKGWRRHMASGTPTEERHALDAIPREELKRLSRLGIPAHRRRVLWPQLCRADELRATEPPGYFASLLAQPVAKPDEAGFAAERQIELDLARTFPGHKLLANEGGTSRLRSVLLAYARREPTVGYVQGMGFVAALLLIFLDEEETAFWCFASIVEWLLPADFYSATLLGLRTEQAVFNELVAGKLPKVPAMELDPDCA